MPVTLASPGSWCAHQSRTGGLPIVPRDSLCQSLMVSRLTTPYSCFLASRNYGYPCWRAQLIASYKPSSINPTSKLLRSYLVNSTFTYSPAPQQSEEWRHVESLLYIFARSATIRGKALCRVPDLHIRPLCNSLDVRLWSPPLLTCLPIWRHKNDRLCILHLRPFCEHGSFLHWAELFHIL